MLCAGRARAVSIENACGVFEEDMSGEMPSDWAGLEMRGGGSRSSVVLYTHR